MAPFAVPALLHPLFQVCVSVTDPSFALTLSCPNKPGIVMKVSALIYEAGGDIVTAQQFDDTLENRFFMRVVFRCATGKMDVPALRAADSETPTIVATRASSCLDPTSGWVDMNASAYCHGCQLCAAFCIGVFPLSRFV